MNEIYTRLKRFDLAVTVLTPRNIFTRMLYKACGVAEFPIVHTYKEVLIEEKKVYTFSVDRDQ